VLHAHPERVYSRAQLLELVWQDNCGSLERVVDTHIKSLRAKFKQIDANLDPIKTHRGLGYSLSFKA
ncbi:MAG: winged helix-turn-helix domain-containing protein, partial [Vibrio sp.]